MYFVCPLYQVSADKCIVGEWERTHLGVQLEKVDISGTHAQDEILKLSKKTPMLHAYISSRWALSTCPIKTAITKHLDMRTAWPVYNHWTGLVDLPKSFVNSLSGTNSNSN